MSLPPEVDTRIRSQFEKLLPKCSQLMQDAVVAERLRRDQEQGIEVIGNPYVPIDRFIELRTQFLTLIDLLSNGNQHLAKIYDETRALAGTREDLEKLRGFILALKKDYEAEMFEGLTNSVEAGVIGDYFTQAEQLLKEGHPGKYDHVPAAVLTGAILEDALRRLCSRHSSPIPLIRTNGESKTLTYLIDDLKKAGVFNEVKAKQLRAWAGIRNAAAHGEFTQFTRQDVEQMLVGVQNFLASYL